MKTTPQITMLALFSAVLIAAAMVCAICIFPAAEEKTAQFNEYNLNKTTTLAQRQEVMNR